MSITENSGGRERRRHVRVRLHASGRLEAPPRAPGPCEIYNMSVGGVLLETRQALRLGQPVVLHLDDFGAISAHVARVTSTVVALAFEGADQGALTQFIASHAQQPEQAEDAPLAGVAE